MVGNQRSQSSTRRFCWRPSSVSLEAIGKSFQGVYLGRAHQIEVGMADPATITELPGIAAAWRRHWRPASFGRYLAIGRWHIALPHLFVVLAAAGLYLALALPQLH